ncbi:MAG: PAS domain-containing sensor histidine kinase [Chloroflexota bacterium]|nr:PAS domain-containing sensor histidine kinase [Chloroflexota bacterium]
MSVKRLGMMLGRLTEPSLAVPERERWTARAFSTFILLLLVTLTLILPLWLAYRTNLVLNMLLIAVMYVALGGAYFISRTARYRVGLRVTIWMIGATISVLVIDGAAEDMTGVINIMKYFVLCVLMAGFVLDSRETMWIAVAFTVVVVLLLTFALRQSIEVVILESLFIGLISALIVLGTALRERYALRLRASEQRYRALFEQSNDPIIVLGLDGVMHEVNSRTVDLLGYSASDLKSMIYSEVVVERERQNVLTLRVRLTRGENISPYERTFRRADDSELTVEMHPSLITYTDGTPPQIHLVMRDLTNRKRSERAAIDAAVERQRGQILAGFVRGASHEFRTPLAIIGTNIHLLRRTPTPEIRDRRLDALQSQVERINRLLNMMLLMVKLDSGEPFQSAAVQVSELLRDLSYHFSIKVGAMLTLVTDIPANLPRVQGDAYFLSEALRQIFNNAVQYTPAGGTISLRAHADATSMYIAISDTGIGVNEEQRGRIFERFYRADEAYNVEGFGLGLSIARAIVEQHAGRIELVSTQGKGSTFTVVLPLEVAGEVAGEAVGVAASAGAGA